MVAVTTCSDFGAQENIVCHCFHCFPIYLPWSDGTRWHDLSWMLSFKPAFSLSSFTFIKRLFSLSLLSAIRVVSSVLPWTVPDSGERKHLGFMPGRGSRNCPLLSLNIYPSVCTSLQSCQRTALRRSSWCYFHEASGRNQILIYLLVWSWKNKFPNYFRLSKVRNLHIKYFL